MEINYTVNIGNGFLVSPLDCESWCVEQFEGFKIAKLSLVMVSLTFLLMSYYFSNAKLKEYLMITGIVILIIYLFINW
jgi:hypothetical protein